jgi:hypothetical protein
MKREEEHVLAVARAEWKRWRKEKTISYTLLSTFLITLALAFLAGTVHMIQMTGYTGYVESQAGSVTELTIYNKRPTYVWAGFYGLVLRVPGFTQQLYEDLDAGGIERSDVFFDCIKYDSLGGPEVFASNISTLIITAENTKPASLEYIDQYIGCSGRPYCANNTFTKNMTIYLGDTPITDIPSTHTYQSSSNNEVFDIGALNISGNLVFVAHLNDSIQAGYNPEYLVNYQLLIPQPENSTQRYYFYNDPYDECAAGGGVGNVLTSTVWGYTIDEDGNTIENATVYYVGSTTTSDSNGFYNISSSVLEGTFNIVATKTNYYAGIEQVIVNITTQNFERNITLETIEEVPTITNNTVTPHVFGKVNNSAGDPIDNVTVIAGNATTTTNSSGHYSFYPTLTFGQNPLVGYKLTYDVHYAYLNTSISTTEINYNFTLELANLNEYPDGPYTTEGDGNGDGDGDGRGPGEVDQIEIIEQIAEDFGQDYWVSATDINKQVRENTFTEEKISIYNFREGNMQLFFTISPSLEDIVKLDKTTATIGTETSDDLFLTIYGTEPIGTYTGTLSITGDLEVDIPVKIEIVPSKFNIESLLMEIELVRDSISIGENLKYRLDMQNLLTEQGYKVNLKHIVLEENNSEIIIQEEEEVELLNSLTLLKELEFPENVTEGDYILRIDAEYLGLYSSVTSPFKIVRPVYLYTFFGIPLWIIFIILSAMSFISLNAFLYHRHVQKKKRFHLALRTDLLPKPGDRSIKLGILAERKEKAYYNIDDLTTHAIVAGATGGGKSIAAQVFVEEMLLKNIAIIVFDPTAQWSGMLRKNEDKKMMSFYPKFGLKPSDARAFPGNVRQVTNELQSIHVEKYMNPGQIQIFTMNKMTPQQIDVFVAGVINNVFKSDPKEHPGLKAVLVFDEVHRLLPKFGGSGKGFLQIERACREFRKWGIGVMLVSQVLSDFVGEIKANINTEVQMRVAEENDLERIKERYGIDALKSLVRAGVGTGMIQNAEYNKGLPYFVNLRPILHNTRRLTDEVLEKYNSYNDQIEDLEYQIEQLEKEKVDTFDLKMELKLVKDKLMSGNFTVVDIYLEGLKPRLEKQWETIGKKPKKREIELIDPNELESSLKKAQEEHAKAKAKDSTGSEEKKEKKEDPGAKIVVAMTFDNGMMVSSFNELKDVLPNMDDDVFKIHVNEEKNEIAKWISEQIDPEFAKKIEPIRTKAEMVTALGEFGKKEEKKDGEKKEGDEKKGKEGEGKDKKEETKSEEKPKEEPSEKPEEKPKEESKTEEKSPEKPKEENPAGEKKEEAPPEKEKPAEKPAEEKPKEEDKKE